MYLLGSIPSPVLFGRHVEILEDDFDQSEEMAYRIAATAASVCFLVAAVIYLVGATVGKQAKDYRTHRMQQAANGRTDEARADEVPLLEEAIECSHLQSTAS